MVVDGVFVLRSSSWFIPIPFWLALELITGLVEKAPVKAIVNFEMRLLDLIKDLMRGCRSVGSRVLIHMSARELRS